MKFCGQCGQGNEENSEFCLQCGAPVSGGATPDAPETGTPEGAAGTTPEGPWGPVAPGPEAFGAPIAGAGQTPTIPPETPGAYAPPLPPGQVPWPGQQAAGTPPAGPQGPVPPPSYYSPQPATDGMAVASLVIGIAPGSSAVRSWAESSR